ncbi:MAG TPA: TaqI-like C-terminal specificity domain-containing protein, partial [Verrucomicrobiae bacterium]
GPASALFDKLQAMPVKLSHVAELFVGVQTDADDVFIVETVSQTGKKLVAYSKFTEREHEFEAAHLKPFLKGSLNIRRYVLTDLTKRLIFPYETRDGESRLITSQEYEDRFPMTWAYLKSCQRRLAERAKGQFADYWHGYVYKKNHTRFEQPKLVVPAIGKEPCFAPDFDGRFYFVGSGAGGGGGYGIVLKPGLQINLRYLLALLNSTLAGYVLKRFSTPFRGGYFALTRQFISQLPIRPIDFGAASERAEHDALVGLVERILAAKRANPAADTTALEREIDARVYRLYGLTPEEIKIVEGAGK